MIPKTRPKYFGIAHRRPVLTRQELYDLVWSIPIIKLAESFGISDVGLSKICDRHRVPTPPRGYWAKKGSGKKVKQTIFVQIDDPLLDRIEIESTHDKMPEPVRAVVEARRAERKISSEPKPEAMSPPAVEPVKDPHPAIRATALALRKGKPSTLGVVEAVGPGLCGISIGTKSVERIIALLDGLASTCESRGLSLTPRDNRMAASVGDDSATFEIKEMTKQVTHVLTATEIAVEEKRRKRNEQINRGRRSWDDHDYVFAPLPPKFDIVRTGKLGIHIFGWGGGLRRSWNDGKTQTLETLLEDFVTGLEAHIVAERLQREEREKSEAEYKALERRRDLAKARCEREAERKRLLNKLVRFEREVAQLRNWQARYEQHAGTEANEDLDRMIDELFDPLGEPPEQRRWW